MWAGGRLTFHAELRVGDAVRQRSEILKVTEKEGRAGRMVFVTVRHETGSERGLAIEEEQDIVYVAMPETWIEPEPMPPPVESAIRATISSPSPVNPISVTWTYVPSSHGVS